MPSLSNSGGWLGTAVLARHLVVAICLLSHGRTTPIDWPWGNPVALAGSSSPPFLFLLHAAAIQRRSSLRYVARFSDLSGAADIPTLPSPYLSRPGSEIFLALPSPQRHHARPSRLRPAASCQRSWLFCASCIASAFSAVSRTVRCPLGGWLGTVDGFMPSINHIIAVSITLAPCCHRYLMLTFLRSNRVANVITIGTLRHTINRHRTVRPLL